MRDEFNRMFAIFLPLIFRPNVLNLNDFVLRHFDLLQLALTSKIAKMESSNVQTQAHLSHSNEPPSSMSKTYLESEDDNQLSLCCLCGKTFPTISSLHYHIDSEHDDANDDGDSASTAEPSSSASDVSSQCFQRHYYTGMFVPCEKQLLRVSRLFL
ncbi:hypothetical protein AAHC03_026229 [Spirometra sp. Aus1]